MTEAMNVIAWSLRKTSGPPAQEIRILVIEGFVLSSKSGAHHPGRYRVTDYGTVEDARARAVAMTQSMEENYGYVLFHEPRHTGLFPSSHDVLVALSGSNGALPWVDALFKKAVTTGAVLVA